MSSAKRFAMGLVVLLLTMGTLVASTSAHGFIASKAGTLKGTQLGTQKISAGSLSISCANATLKGSIGEHEEEATVEKVKIKYEKCEAGASKIAISEAEYSFDAEGTVRILEPLTITDETGGCNVKLSTPGAAAHTVKYVSGTKLEIDETVTEVDDEPSGGACGSTSGTNGKLEGALGLELTGGTLKWGTLSATVEPSEVKFAATKADESEISTIKFEHESLVTETEIDPGDEGFDFAAEGNKCHEALIEAGDACTIEVLFMRPEGSSRDHYAELRVHFETLLFDDGVITVLLSSL